MHDLVLVLAAFGAGTLYLIDSTTWWIRGTGRPGTVGLYVSRTNIYQYFSRFLALSFNMIVAFSIENGASALKVCLVLAAGFGLSGVAHLVVLMGNGITHWLIALLNRMLILPANPLPPDTHLAPFKRAIAMPTALATLFYNLGIALPLLLAVTFPAYRMSLSYLGQIANAFGTVMFLFLVDQVMYKSLDRGDLAGDLRSYSIGRIVALVTASLLCAVMAAVYRYE